MSTTKRVPHVPQLDQNFPIERTEPMKIHKNMVIRWLESHPEDESHIVPDEFRGRLPEYLDTLRRAQGQYFIGGMLEQGN